MEAIQVQDLARQKIYITNKTKKYRISGDIDNWCNQDLKVMSDIREFPKGTEVTVDEVLVNPCHPEYFSGYIKGTNIKIDVISFCEVTKKL